MPVPRFNAIRKNSTLAGAEPTAPSVELSRLLPLWPHELNDMTLDGRERRVALLRKALRGERRRGLAGHWTYDLARHAALLRCYKRETAELAKAQIETKFSQALGAPKP